MSEPIVGDMLYYKNEYDRRSYVGLLIEEFYLVGDSYSSFRVMWVMGEGPVLYNDRFGLSKQSIVSSLSYRYFRDGREICDVV